MQQLLSPKPNLTKMECLGTWERLDPRVSVVVFNPWGGTSRLGAGCLAYFYAKSQADGSVGARASSRLALEGFRDELLRTNQPLISHVQQEPCPSEGEALGSSIATILHRCIAIAHERVTQFSREMGAGGSLPVVAVSMLICNQEVVIARCGAGDACLTRGGGDFPFFATTFGVKQEEQMHQAASLPLGSKGSLKCEVVSVKLFPGDMISIRVDGLGSSKVQSQFQKLDNDRILEGGFKSGGLGVAIGPECLLV
jgi:hypothetical protein